MFKEPGGKRARVEFRSVQRGRVFLKKASRSSQIGAPEPSMPIPKRCPSSRCATANPDRPSRNPRLTGTFNCIPLCQIVSDNFTLLPCHRCLMHVRSCLWCGLDQLEPCAHLLDERPLLFQFRFEKINF